MFCMRSIAMRLVGVFVSLLLCSNMLFGQSGTIDVSTDYSSREVMIHTSNGNLYGTLTIPLKNEYGIVVLIIPDFGLTDRDGNSPKVGENNSLKMLAEGLAREGVSTLRVEKREVTESKKSAMVKPDMRFEDMVEDAVRWLRFLKSDQRFSKVAVLGHSEGALVGILASEISDVDYYISIAGFGRAGNEIIEDRLEKQLTAEQMDTARKYIAELKNGNTIEDVSPFFLSIFSQSIQSYLVSWFKYTPAEEIASLNAKVLLVHGENDKQVPAKEIELLALACPNAQELLIHDMNHVLKGVKSGKDHEHIPLAEGLVKGIADFLKVRE